MTQVGLVHLQFQNLLKVVLSLLHSNLKQQAMVQMLFLKE